MHSQNAQKVLQQRCPFTTFATLLVGEHHRLLRQSLFKGVHCEVDQRFLLITVISVGNHLAQLRSISSGGKEGRHQAADALLHMTGVLRRQAGPPLATAAPAKGQADVEQFHRGEDHLKWRRAPSSRPSGGPAPGGQLRTATAAACLHWTPPFGVFLRQAAFQIEVKEVRQFGELHENGAHRRVFVEEMDCAQVDKGVGKVVDGEETDRLERNVAEEVKVSGYGKQRFLSFFKGNVGVRLHVNGHRRRRRRLVSVLVVYLLSLSHSIP